MMPILKSQFIFLLFIILAWSPGVAQPVDAVEVSGRIKWKNPGITGYPNELTIIAGTKQVYLAPIDSTGKYDLRLPAGSYRLALSKHYHWMEEEYIRINDSVSTLSITVTPGTKFIAPDLILDTISLGNLLPVVGVAQNFTKKKAALLDDFIKKRNGIF